MVVTRDDATTATATTYDGSVVDTDANDKDETCIEAGFSHLLSRQVSFNVAAAYTDASYSLPSNVINQRHLVVRDVVYVIMW